METPYKGLFVYFLDEFEFKNWIVVPPLPTAIIWLLYSWPCLHFLYSKVLLYYYIICIYNIIINNMHILYQFKRLHLFWHIVDMWHFIICLDFLHGFIHAFLCLCLCCCILKYIESITHTSGLWMQISPCKFSKVRQTVYTPNGLTDESQWFCFSFNLTLNIFHVSKNVCRLVDVKFKCHGKCRETPTMYVIFTKAKITQICRFPKDSLCLAKFSKIKILPQNLNKVILFVVVFFCLMPYMYLLAAFKCSSYIILCKWVLKHKPVECP